MSQSAVAAFLRDPVTVSRKELDLRPFFHPGISRVGWSFEPARLDAATGRGAKPPIARSGPSRCDAELLIVA